MKHREVTRELDRESARNLKSLVLFGIPGMTAAVAALWPTVDHRVLIVSMLVGCVGSLSTWFGSRLFLAQGSLRNLNIIRAGTLMTSIGCGGYSLFGMAPDTTGNTTQLRIVLISVTMLSTAAAANAASRVLTLFFTGPISLSLSIAMIRNDADPMLFLGIVGFLLVTDRAHRTTRANTRQVFEEKSRADDLTRQLAAALKLSEQESLHDPLTGAGNRRMLERHVDDIVGVEQHSVICIDLDRFKELNDAYGHAVGDELLIAATARVQAVLRLEDQLIRSGGDEFIVIARTDINGARGVAERILRQLQLGYGLSVGHVAISASIGIATAFPGQPIEVAQRRADQAMYRAKSRGRNQVAEWNDRTDASAAEWDRIEASA